MSSASDDLARAVKQLVQEIRLGERLIQIEKSGTYITKVRITRA